MTTSDPRGPKQNSAYAPPPQTPRVVRFNGPPVTVRGSSLKNFHPLTLAAFAGLTDTDIMLVLIDNYDSFTYNLVQTFGQVRPGLRIEVFRNDKVTIPQIEALKPTHICISPGPCSPTEAGISNDVIFHFAPRLPVLGVCLGHQCIGHVYGGIVERAQRLMHGKTDRIYHDGKGIYRGMPSPFTATRYHSLIIRKGSLNDDFVITAWTDQDEIMGVRHKTWPLEGVQYHPESFLTEHGATLLKNFLDQ